MRLPSPGLTGPSRPMMRPPPPVSPVPAEAHDETPLPRSHRSQQAHDETHDEHAHADEDACPDEPPDGAPERGVLQTVPLHLVRPHELQPAGSGHNTVTQGHSGSHRATSTPTPACRVRSQNGHTGSQHGHTGSQRVTAGQTNTKSNLSGHSGGTCNCTSSRTN